LHQEQQQRGLCLEAPPVDFMQAAAIAASQVSRAKRRLPNLRFLFAILQNNALSTWATISTQDED
jgi:hypothetical protein